MGIKKIPQRANLFKNREDTPKFRASDDFDKKCIYRPIRSVFMGRIVYPPRNDPPRKFRELFRFYVLFHNPRYLPLFFALWVYGYMFRESSVFTTAHIPIKPSQFTIRKHTPKPPASHDFDLFWW